MEQRVGVGAGAQYELRGFGKVAVWSADSLIVGVQDHGGPPVSDVVTWTDFQELRIPFVARADSATIYLWNPSSGNAWGDGFRVERLP